MYLITDVETFFDGAAFVEQGRRVSRLSYQNERRILDRKLDAS